MIKFFISFFAVLLVSLLPNTSNAYLSLLKKLPPEEHGNILINRTSEKNGVKPATFSHWLHRTKYTCRVCHFELEFNMQANTTQITEAANKAGKFCGTAGCHDGKAAFGHEKPHCQKCHNGNRAYGKEKFSRLSKLPKTEFGNDIDWVAAFQRRMITPVTYMVTKAPEVAVVDAFKVAAEWNSIPPAVFPHKPHTDWLDCNNCHPDIFDIKKHENKTYSMVRMITKREYCCVCHLDVAFPMQDCKRCHKVNRQPEQ